MKRLFFGGVHPRYKKEMSTKTENLQTVTPKQVVIPLQQHVGDICGCLVKVGETVLVGQKIGDGEGMCVPVHSSVSGTVVAIEPRLHPNGQMIESVIIDNDFRNNTVQHTAWDIPLEQMDADTILYRLRESGIVGMGGAAYSTNIKALSALQKIDTLIANGCECEPYITADDILLRTNPEQVLEGVMILHKALSPNRTVLAVEDNKAAAIKKLQELNKKYSSIELVILPTRYPQGSEKQLIQAVTGRRVPPESLPVNVGCVVFNVSTFAAINKAVREGMPLTERIVTVSGEAVANPQNLIVPIGTPFKDVIEAAGGLNRNTERVINGGPMMGTAQSDLSVPVVKATNSILCLLKEKNYAENGTDCIRCGKCVEVCPMLLKPLYIRRFAGKDDVRELRTLNVIDCIECGCCSFICPAKLPLVEDCRKGKKLVKGELK